MSLICLALAAESAKLSFRPFVLRFSRKTALLALAFTVSHLAAQNVPTTTALQPTANAGSYTLYATVSSNNTTAGIPSGQVNFTDRTTGALLGTATLVPSSVVTGRFNVTASNTLPTTDTCYQPIHQVIASDADGDGKLDLVMAHTFSCMSATNSALGNVLVARGNGDGTFRTPTSYAAPFPSTSSSASTGFGEAIATGNFGSHSGLPGYVLVIGSQIVTLPDINSPFNAPVALDFSPTGPIYVSPDSSWVAVGTIAGFSIYNNNAGTLTLANSFTISSGASVIAAMKYGLAIGSCTHNSTNPNHPVTGTVTLFTGTSAASLQAGASFSIINGCIVGMVAGGFRGSTYNDILFIANPDFSLNTTSQLMALDDDGSGNYTQFQYPLAAINNLSPWNGTLIAADLNNDGNLDIATLASVNASIVRDDVFIYYGNGSGGFQPGALPGQPSAQAVVVSDPDSLAFGNFTPGIPGIAITSYATSSYTVAQLVPAYVSASGAPDGNITISGGPDQVVATYAGDGTFAGSTSPALPLYALPVATTLRLIPSAATIVAGQAVSFNTLLSPYAIPGISSDTTKISFSGLPTGSYLIQQLSGRGQSSAAPPAGAYTITASFPNTGYTSGVLAAATSNPVTLTVLASAPTLTPTTLTLTAAPAAPIPGQTTTLTATLAPYTISGASTDGELVTFKNGNIPLGTAKLVSGVATLTTAPLSAGTNTFSVIYEGDIYFTSATSTVNVIVAAPTLTPTTLTLTANPAAPIPGQTTTLTATVAPYTITGASTDGELVAFNNGNTSLGTAKLASGVATLTSAPLSAGTNTFSVIYPGDIYFTSATSTISVNVVAPTPTPTTLTLTANPAAPTSGQSTTFTATLVPYTITGASTEGELVTFKNGNTTLGTAKLTSGVATLTSAPLSAGASTFSVSYPGDMYFAATTSAITVTVATPPPSTIAVTPASTSLTIPNPGGSASTALTFAPGGGFNGTVAITCAVTYTGTGTATAPPTCSLNPATVSIPSGGAATSTLTINTTASTSASNITIHRTTLTLAGTFAGAFLLLLAPGRRKPLLQLACLFLLATLGTLAGCSGGPTTPTTGTNSSTSTTLGSYNVTVTATSGSVTTTTSLAVTVQ